MKPPSNKLGRNDPCWCGSGKKFKKCHLNRERQERTGLDEAIAAIRRWKDHKVCLHPDAPGGCSGPIINAHTLSRATALETIAKNGHVYTINGNLDKLITFNGQFQATLIGVKKASTFTGFCAKHDNELFKRLDEHHFAIDPETAFLLGYRSMCREVHAKDGVVALGKEQLAFDRGLSPTQQRNFQGYFQEKNHVTQVGLRDLQHAKHAYDRILRGRHWNEVRFLSIRLDETPTIACAGGKYPHFDFLGNTLQDFDDLDQVLESIYLSLFASGDGGYCVFTWLEHEASPASLVESLLRLPRIDIPNAIVRLAFSSFENIFMAPTWWESLSPETQARLVKRLRDTVDPLQDFDPSALMSDKHNYVNWRLKAVTTNDPRLRTLIDQS